MVALINGGDILNVNNLFQIRVTGVLIEDSKILLVKQKLSSRNWSLPGGRLERGELLEEGVIREVHEETGLETEVEKLLYVCDKPNADPPLIHITFLLERNSGEIKLPSNEFDDNTIYDVQMVPIDEINKYGFTEKFKTLIKNNFSDSGRYAGLKQEIGL